MSWKKLYERMWDRDSELCIKACEIPKDTMQKAIETKDTDTMIECCSNCYYLYGFREAVSMFSQELCDSKRGNS